MVIFAYDVVHDGVLWQGNKTQKFNHRTHLPHPSISLELNVFYDQPWRHRGCEIGPRMSLLTLVNMSISVFWLWLQSGSLEVVSPLSLFLSQPSFDYITKLNKFKVTWGSSQDSWRHEMLINCLGGRGGMGFSRHFGLVCHRPHDHPVLGTSSLRWP